MPVVTALFALATAALLPVMMDPTSAIVPGFDPGRLSIRTPAPELAAFVLSIRSSDVKAATPRSPAPMWSPACAQPLTATAARLNTEAPAVAPNTNIPSPDPPPA